MSTYLELCQEVALESGTVPTLGEPSTVTGQSGRLQRIVGWTSKAWEDVQILSDAWRWMQADFSGQTISGVHEYDASAMGITERFRGWDSIDHKQKSLYTLYLTSSGPTDEGRLHFKDYEWMRENVFIGDWLSNSEKHGKPYYITVSPDNKLMPYPVPDAAYTLRGKYRKAPQVLTDGSDVPECPAMFHDVIVWKALIRLAIFDEAYSSLPGYERMYQNLLSQLALEQLPQVQLGGALA